jgi:hypothetical protein
LKQNKHLQNSNFLGFTNLSMDANPHLATQIDRKRKRDKITNTQNNINESTHEHLLQAQISKHLSTAHKVRGFPAFERGPPSTEVYFAANAQ